ncbi:DUF6461 domain-containing protein [Actinoplanes sp. CA-142083]|uniref:DUF6461 domain-containing protein n=1 Tax=Actinoplanes sp. CA-142083 TaxID=3239903 RepID=UPI003D94CA5E
MAARADNYAWFPATTGELANAYCVTLVRGVTPDAVLSRLKSKDQRTIRGIDELVQLVGDHDAGDLALIGVTEVRGWSLMVEPNGFIGVSPRYSKLLSAGTLLVAHYLNVNLQDEFVVAEDGTITAAVEPSAPGTLHGPKADQLADAMRSVGYDLTGETEPGYRFELLAFALAEELTGLRLQEDDVVGATYLGGYAKKP